MHSFIGQHEWKGFLNCVCDIGFRYHAYQIDYVLFSSRPKTVSINLKIDWVNQY